MNIDGANNPSSSKGRDAAARRSARSKSASAKKEAHKTVNGENSSEKRYKGSAKKGKSPQDKLATGLENTTKLESTIQAEDIINGGNANNHSDPHEDDPTERITGDGHASLVEPNNITNGRDAG